MERHRKTAVAMLAATALVLTGCSSSGSGAKASNGKTTIKIGVIYPNTGPFSGSYKSTLDYVKARIEKANATNEVPGVQLEVVGRDDASSPTGALAAAKDLVENQKVFGVVDPDPLLFASYRYLAQHNVPTTGPGNADVSFTDPISKSLFSAAPVQSARFQAATTFGNFLKSKQITSTAVLAYSDAPSSVAVAKNQAASAKAAGISTPYVNTSSIKVGTTDFTSVALAIKNSGAQAVFVAMDYAAEANISVALKQAGANIKVSLGGGYGSDTLSDPKGVAGLQDWYFFTPPQLGAPVELKSPSTESLAADFKKYANLEGPPSNAAVFGWMSANLFVEGLKVGGNGSVTKDSFITNLRNDHNYNPYDGLFGKQGIDLGKTGDVQAFMAPGNCQYIVQLKDKAFVPDTSASPVCGELIPGAFAMGG
jgi:branched-chain amino acid transport system substrate-binding protein